MTITSSLPSTVQEESARNWSCGITLKAIREGQVTWTISVPAAVTDDERYDVRSALEWAFEQAVEMHEQCEHRFGGGRGRRS